MEHLDDDEPQHTGAVLVSQQLQGVHAQLEPRRLQVGQLERALQKVALEALHQLGCRRDRRQHVSESAAALVGNELRQGVQNLVRAAGAMVEQRARLGGEAEELLGDDVVHGQARRKRVIEARYHAIDRRACEHLAYRRRLDQSQYLADKGLQRFAWPMLCQLLALPPRELRFLGSLCLTLGKQAFNLDDRFEVVVRHQRAHNLHHHRCQQEAQRIAHHVEDAADHFSSLQTRTRLVHHGVQQRRAPRLSEALEKLLSQVRVGFDDTRHLGHSLLLGTELAVELIRVHERRQLQRLIRC